MVRRRDNDLRQMNRGGVVLSTILGVQGRMPVFHNRNKGVRRVGRNQQDSSL